MTIHHPNPSLLCPCPLSRRSPPSIISPHTTEQRQTSASLPSSTYSGSENIPPLRQHQKRRNALSHYDTATFASGANNVYYFPRPPFPPSLLPTVPPYASQTPRTAQKEQLYTTKQSGAHYVPSQHWPDDCTTSRMAPRPAPSAPSSTNRTNPLAFPIGISRQPCDGVRQWMGF